MPCGMKLAACGMPASVLSVLSVLRALLVISGLYRNSACRLCCESESRITIAELKRHPFFAPIDWAALRTQATCH
jgi:hypothetical protein